MKKIFMLFILTGLSTLVLAQDSQLEYNRFDFVFNRGFMLVTGDTDSMPISGARSGSWFLGLGFNFDVNKTLAFRITPGVTWIKANYRNEDANKVFPSTTTTFTSEKHRVTYLDLPVGIKLNITHNENGKPQIFVEGGGYAGIKVGGVYKTVARDEVAAQTTKIKLTGVKDLETLRYGIYGKLGYRWVSVYYSYRLSDVFEKFQSVDGKMHEGLAIPPMELGVSLHIF